MRQGLLRGAHDGPCIALRADMDALPVLETTGLPFASETPGVMHACGHDTHMAMMLGTAQILSAAADRIHGSVKFVFQPAEEGHHGAPAMIADGVLEGVDEIYGCHTWTYDKVGTVGVKDGPVMACSDRFDITVKGKGGHGAVPQGTCDASAWVACVCAAPLFFPILHLTFPRRGVCSHCGGGPGDAAANHRFPVLGPDVQRRSECVPNQRWQKLQRHL